ncbi:hypothetical protein HHI36_013729 [Cryptolaemus montrouzieri]|uniref:Uncharacterized protein n=1 Tax=Cryptolaemus montrouzieri TaxID=559131 RepID=A0ABD2NIY1_9CUCU
MLMNIFQSLVRTQLDYVGRCTKKSNGKNESGSIPRDQDSTRIYEINPNRNNIGRKWRNKKKSIRRKWLASKLITKLFYTNNQRWIKKVEELARFHDFWNNKTKPPYIAAMGKLKITYKIK